MRSLTRRPASVHSQHHSLALALAAASAALAAPAHAGDATWSGNGSTAGDPPTYQWSDPLNWDGTNVPGVADGTFTSTETATFTGAPTNTSVFVDLNRNVRNITVTNTASNFTVGGAAGNTLYFSNGGTVLVDANVTAAAITSVSAPVLLMGSTFTANNLSTTTTAGLRFGAIAPGTNANTTLFLNGLIGSGGGTNLQLSGVLSDGTAGGKLGIVKTGIGAWQANLSSGTNTYSGDTDIREGVFRINAVGGLSANSRYLVAPGAILRTSVSGGTGKEVVLNANATTLGVLQASNSGIRVNFANDTGPAVTMNFADYAGAATSAGAPLNLTGAVAGQGGFRLVNGPGTPQISWGSALDLGALERPFEVADSAAAAVDLQLNQPISGTGGGLLKLGPGMLKFQAANSSGTPYTFTGALEVREGAVSFRNNTDGSADNIFNGAMPLRVTGGTIDFNAQRQTFSSVTVTRGSMTGSLNTTVNTRGTVAATSFAFNVAASDTASASAVLADSTAAATLTKTGGGVATLTAPNTYTGATVVNGGTLNVSGSHAAALPYAVNAGGTLGGTGSIAAAVNVVGGTIAPGSGGVGTLTTAAVTLDANSTLALEIASTSSSDKLVVSGAALAANGKIVPSLVGGFVPAASDSFEVVTAGSLVGLFTNPFGYARTADGKGGLLIDASAGTSVVLRSYQRVGDVDTSGAVNNQDIAPFVALLTGGSATGAVGFAADVDGNGVVNNQDIAPFVALLTGGRPLADVAGDPDFAPLVALVPEPGTLGLLAAAGVLALRRRRR
jgi:autotransporter-associated beta strand protein